MERDVPEELAREIRGRREDAAGDAVAFDARKPTLHLIEPATIGRGVVHRDARMRREPVVHRLGLVRRQVVDHKVDGLAARRGAGDRVEEVDEFRAGVPHGDLALHVPGAHVERRGEGARPVPDVREPVGLGPPGTQRQHRIRTVQRLDGGLLIDAEHHRIGGRRDVEANNVRRLRLEVRIGTARVPLQAMRLEAMQLPHFGDGRVRHAELRGEPPTRPVRHGGGGLRLERQPHDLRLQRGTHRMSATGARRVGHGEDAPLDEAALPDRNEAIRARHARRDGGVGLPVGQRQHHAHPLGDGLAQRRLPQHLLQRATVIGGKDEIHNRGKHIATCCNSRAIHIATTPH